MKLALNDGTVVDEGSAGVLGNELWIYLPGYTMQQAAEKAFNANATRRIIWQYGDTEETYIGYTDCDTIKRDDDRIMVCLLKEGTK